MIQNAMVPASLFGAGAHARVVSEVVRHFGAGTCVGRTGLARFDRYWIPMDVKAVLFVEQECKTPLVRSWEVEAEGSVNGHDAYYDPRASLSHASSPSLRFVVLGNPRFDRIADQVTSSIETHVRGRTLLPIRVESLPVRCVVPPERTHGTFRIVFNAGRDWRFRENDRECFASDPSGRTVYVAGNAVAQIFDDATVLVLRDVLPMAVGSDGRLIDRIFREIGAAVSTALPPMLPEPESTFGHAVRVDVQGKVSILDVPTDASAGWIARQALESAQGYSRRLQLLVNGARAHALTPVPAGARLAITALG